MNIQPVLKMHTQDKWGWFLVPNTILFSVFLLNVIISLIISGDKGATTAGVSYIVVYSLIMGILVVTQTFQYAIGMSIRRVDYFFGTVVMAVSMSVFFGIFLLILATAEHATNGWGLNMRFFHLPYVNDGTILEQLIIFIVLYIHFFLLGFMLSSLGFRYGKKGMFITAIAVLLIMTLLSFIATYQGYWMDIFHWFVTHTAVEVAYWLIIPTLIYGILPYHLLRKASV